MSKYVAARIAVGSAVISIVVEWLSLFLVSDPFSGGLWLAPALLDLISGPKQAIFVYLRPGECVGL